MGEYDRGYKVVGSDSLRIGKSMFYAIARLENPSASMVKRPGVLKVLGQLKKYTGSSFYPNCLKEWNDLAPEMRELPTVTSFKSKLLSLVRPPLKSTYGICDPKGLAILTQLRVGLSKLKSHKFNHNFRDTVDPICLINDGIEDTEHFLLQCHEYSEQRRDLLGAINEVLELHNISNLPNHTIVRTMLYSDERFTYNQNRQILEATVRFIRTSERFS